MEIVPLDERVRDEIARNNYLLFHALSMTSQDGEDGILGEVFRCIFESEGTSGFDKRQYATETGRTSSGIGSDDDRAGKRAKDDAATRRGRWCVEFGAFDGYLHSNTWNLVKNQDWKAVFIEPFERAFLALKATYEDCPDVYCYNEFVTVSGESSLDSILARTPIPSDPDLMVIDIDGNDLLVWRACKKYRPKVVMIEFNPFAPHDVSFAKKSEQDGFGSASLLADCELAKEKGYELVCVVGGNAIFVRKEYFHLFDILDNRPEAMFRARLETKIFQGYDGTLFLAGNKKLIWLYQLDRAGEFNHVEITDADIQVLPEGLRVFRPRLTYENRFLDEHACALDVARTPSNHLLAFRHNVTSECGEDGIIKEIFKRLDVSSGFCVEVGAHDGKRLSNTWSLLHEQDWNGLLIESNPETFLELQASCQGNRRITAVHAEITTRPGTSLDTILSAADVPVQFDFLCIDIEGNDFNLWSSLQHFRPKVVLVDVNPSIPNDVIFTQEDDPQVHLGSSLRAFIELAASKGYELAAVTTWNAFFVDRTLFFRLEIDDNSIDKMYYPIFEMKIFQSLYSYLQTSGCDRLVRQNYVFDPEQLQPVPGNIRQRPPRPVEKDSDGLGAPQSVFYT